MNFLWYTPCMEKLYSMNVSVYQDDALFRESFRLLSETRKQKVDAFRFRKDKNLCLGAGVLLNLALSEYGLSEAVMVYGETGNKKPVFLNAPEIHFNISHSGEMVILALSDAPVGCDIEQIGTADLRISRRFFTENEHGLLAACRSDGERNDLFFRMWTIKESYMKYTGEGMRLPLSEFEIDFSGDRPKIIRDGHPADCFVTEFDFFPGYRCAVISAREETPELSCCGIRP